MLRKTWNLLLILSGLLARSSSPAQPVLITPPLQMTMVMLETRPSLPAFQLRLTNTGDRDLVLSLGMLLGTKQYLDAIHFSVSDASGKTIQLVPVRMPAGVAGRADPLIVSLPVAASFSFPVNLAAYCRPVQGGCPPTFFWTVFCKGGLGRDECSRSSTFRGMERTRQIFTDLVRCRSKVTFLRNDVSD